MRIGTAPVSFGIYENPGFARQAAAETMLDLMARAGYDGAELGPPGLFGTPDLVAGMFAARGLAVVGAYIPVFGNGAAQRSPSIDRSLAELAAAGGPALAILADAGNATLEANPARGDDPTHALDPRAFAELCDRVNRLSSEVRALGLVPSFHPHLSTYVETPDEVDRLLAATEVGLTFDTGHIALGGGDLIACWSDWRPRVNHIHLKDVRFEVLTRAKSERRADFNTWWADVSTPLGDGDLDLSAFVRKVAGDGYDGWLVLEQDRAPCPPDDYPMIAAQQRKNLEWLRRLVPAGDEQPLAKPEKGRRREPVDNVNSED